MPVGQLVALRNKRNGVVVLTPDPADSRTYLEFQAAGDPGGADTHYVPESVAALPACVKAVLHDVLEIEENALTGSAAQAFQQQMAVALQQRQRQEQQIAASIDRPENRDLVGQACVGPGERAGHECGAPVALSEKQRAEIPPLCARHQHLRTEYVQVEDPDYTGTKVKMNYRWLRVSLGAREQGAQ